MQTLKTERQKDIFQKVYFKDEQMEKRSMIKKKREKRADARSRRWVT